MIISKQKNLAKYFLCLCILCLISCYENTEGCLDITALNYNAAAETDCEMCCTYPKLQISINPFFDTLSFTTNRKYVLNAMDSILVDEMYMILSEFSLQGENAVHRVSDTHAFSATQEIDDIAFIDFSGNSSDIGTIAINDSLLSLQFQVGLIDAIDNKDNNFVQHPSLETLIDSMYYDTSDRIEFFRIAFTSISGQDTLEHLIKLSGQNELFSETFEFNTNIDYGENIVISLDINILRLFLGIDFDAMNEEMIRETVLNNLKTQLFK